MTTVKLVFAFIGRKPLTWAFHVLTLAIGVAVLIAVLLSARGLDERINRDLAGVDLVVGAQGSPLQLILSTLFHIDAPTGNIQHETAERLARNAMVAVAAPVSLGDNIRGVRIVGTDERILQLYRAELAQGVWFKAPMEVVLGAEAANRLGKSLGARFVGTHGLSEGGEAHGEHAYVVVGVLAPTGSAIDRVALTATQSVWDVHGHKDEAAPKTGAPTPGASPPKTESHDHSHDHTEAKPAEAKPAPPREVTAVLVRYKNQATGALMVPRFVRTIPNTQAAAPAIEAARLNELFGVGANVLGAFGYGLIGLAGLGFFVALFAAVQSRRNDLVLLRTLGAKTPVILAVTAMEALILGLLGGALGAALGRAGAEFAAAEIARTGPTLALAPIGAYEGAAIAAAAAIALACAIFPAIMAARASPSAVLKRGT